jgi:hypothetical protein
MPSETGSFEPAHLRARSAAARRDPALVDRPLEIPRRQKESERFLIRTDVANVDRAIARALALAVEGIRCRIEVVRC